MLYFYILVDPHRDGVYKVGITKNKEQRLRSYRTASPEAFFHKIYEIPEKKHEKEILYQLSGSHRVVREVVHGNLRIIQNIIEGYLEENELL